jgi:hypothetical protein
MDTELQHYTLPFQIGRILSHPHGICIIAPDFSKLAFTDCSFETITIRNTSELFPSHEQIRKLFPVCGYFGDVPVTALATQPVAWLNGGDLLIAEERSLCCFTAGTSKVRKRKLPFLIHDILAKEGRIFLSCGDRFGQFGNTLHGLVYSYDEFGAPEKLVIPFEDRFQQIQTASYPRRRGRLL